MGSSATASQRLYSFRANSNRAHTSSWASTNHKAFFRLSWPLVSGRKRVRSTCLSMSRSKISLKQHPMPRISRAPSEKMKRRSSVGQRSEEHKSELQSLMRISYAVFCLKKKNKRFRKYRKYEKIE